MKRGILVFIFFWVLTLPFYFDLFHPGLPQTHDADGHVIRLVEFDQALSDGNFPPRWAKRLNGGLGYPFFDYNYPLIYLFGDIFHKLGLSYIDSTKALFLLSFPLSGYFSYLWLTTRFSKVASFAGGLAYTITPYHLLNIYVRGDLGEVVSLTFVPLAFYFLEKIRKTKLLSYVVLLALTLTTIIASHNLTALIFLPIIFVYGFYLFIFKRDFNFLKNAILSFDLGFLLSCLFWLPALYDRRYIIIDSVIKDHIDEHFLKLSQLIYPSWGYSLSKIDSGDMSFQIGIVSLGIIILTPLVLILARKSSGSRSNLYLAALAFALIQMSVWMMLPKSLEVWDRFSMLGYLQFPWRLLGIIALAVSFLAAFITHSFRTYSKLLLLPLICLLIFLNKDYARAYQYTFGRDSWYQDQPFKGTTTAYNEHTPIWQKVASSSARFTLLNGQADIVSDQWRTNYHLFEVDAKDKSEIADQTAYFPGWTVFVDKKEVELLDKEKTKGLIGFTVPEGKHSVEVRLLETPLHRAANLISLGTLVFCLVLLIKSKEKRKFRVW
jgi:hypothetical protein